MPACGREGRVAACGREGRVTACERQGRVPACGREELPASDTYAELGLMEGLCMFGYLEV